MEMPSFCARCGGTFELNDMYPSAVEGWSGTTVECRDCHRKAPTPTEETR